MAAKKNTLSVEFLLRGKKWCGKTRLTSHDLLVTNWKLESTSWDSNVWFQTHQLKVQIHEFKSRNCESKFTSSRIFSSLKTQVNRLKTASFSKTQKSFGNSWDNMSVQFLVIISCYTFPLFHSYGFTRNQCE